MPTITNPVNAKVQGLQNFNSSTGAWTGRTITNGGGLSITNGDGTAGNPTLTVIGGGLPWTDEATSFSAAANNGYFVTGNATATLPSAPANGSIVAIFVDGAVTVTITGNTGQTIQFSSVTSAAAGTAVNTSTGDSCYLVYRSTDTKWVALSFVGNWTIT